MYFLNEYYGFETKSLEFKEFCIKYNDKNLIDLNDILNMIKYNFIDDKMKYLIVCDLKKYIYNILPKYISCFGNASIDGKIIIGINDKGFISGVPIHNSININYLKHILYESVKKTIDINIKCSTKNIDKYIKININKLKINKYILECEDEINDIYTKFCEQTEYNNKLMDDFYLERHKWLYEMELYTTKLCSIVNTLKTRNELIDYINENNFEKNKNDLIVLLKSDKLISIPIGIDIVEYKEDKKSIVYWLTEYKDYKMKEMLNIKPKKPTNLPLVNINNIFLKLSSLTNRLISDGYDYYLIEIEINLKNIIDTNDLIMYNKDNKNISKCRTIINNIPCCI